MASRVLLLQLFLFFALAFVWSVDVVVDATDTESISGENETEMLLDRSASMLTQSPFVRRRLQQMGSGRGRRLTELTCTKNASICLDKNKNPLGGHTCCQLLPPLSFAVCRDTNNHILNCGKCGNMCKLGQTCCSGSCVYTIKDVNNCGKCGNHCINRRCRLGFCGYSSEED